MGERFSCVAVIASTTLPEVREALPELFGGGPVYLVDTCVFVEVAQCFLFDREGADAVPDRTAHDIVLTADCAWRLMKSWIERRSRLVEERLEAERKRAGAGPGLLVRGVPLSDTCELRFEFARGYALIVGPYQPKIDFRALKFGGPRIECSHGRYSVE